MRASEIMTEAANTITLWHGGRNLESDYLDVQSHKKGRWEHGPGLYLTSHYETAVRYAKGGGKLYRVTVRQGRDISDVVISLDDAIEFVNRYVVGSKKKLMAADLRSNVARVGHLNAEVLVNLCLNNEALPNSKTNALRQFLIDHGADYAFVSRYGGRDETVVVVINPRVISKVEIVTASKVRDSFVLPANFS